MVPGPALAIMLETMNVDAWHPGRSGRRPALRRITALVFARRSRFFACSQVKSSIPDRMIREGELSLRIPDVIRGLNPGAAKLGAPPAAAFRRSNATSRGRGSGIASTRERDHAIGAIPQR